MSLKSIIESTELHGANLISMHLSEGYFEAQVNNICINIDNDTKYAITIKMIVKSANKDGKHVERLDGEAKGSSIIQLKRSGQSVDLIVDWRDYDNKDYDTHVYSFDIESFDFQVVDKS